MQPTRANNSTPNENVLAVALELSRKSWKIALHDGKHTNPTIKTVSHEGAAQRLDELVEVIDKIKVRWGLAPDTRTVILYEAGQDGFWIARALIKLGYEALICDPASILVERHARRAKTDRLDAIRLVGALLGWLHGEMNRMRVIRIPPPEAEAQRHLARDRGELQKEVMQHRDRIRKLLYTVGCWEGADGDIAQLLANGELRCHDGSPLPAELKERLTRECQRMALAEQQFKTLENEAAQHLSEESRERVRRLQQLRAVGPVSAMRLQLELFWRRFQTRQQVGACVGLVPQPYDSGQSRTDQGISKQGNRRVRSLLIEIAWMWLRYQPTSSISRWYAQRIAGTGGNKRIKRIAIVAVARRLVIELWRYLEEGIVPEGTQLKY